MEGKGKGWGREERKERGKREKREERIRERGEERDAIRNWVFSSNVRVTNSELKMFN